MRTFIAIELSPEIKDRLDLLIRKLKPAANNIKWVSKENLHLTLKFLGEINDQQTEMVKSVLEGIVSQSRPFHLALKGTGSFPPGQSRIRVVWVGISADPVLFELQKLIENSLEEKGFLREERPFTPHLTIGRAKIPAKLDSLRAELERLKDEDFGAMEVKEITFFQSILRPQGPEYRVLSHHRLP
ncbi:MAG: RNA 2',3'-cyclic phosphodiesterase [Candidatus Saccharicenans sp.]|nr:MAG: RNA 2',3'-cyclic phosphodiesterase [Candidatus Aminicenantes bacterium]HEK85114.1 RNA 2',3'-cyclic phosphodiesterase [Candidatus Aminicenantes bacterium]